MPTPTIKTLRNRAFQSSEELLRFANHELLPLLGQLIRGWIATYRPASDSITASGTLDADVSIALVDATAGPVTVTLSDSRQAMVRVVKVDASANTVTVTPVEGGVTLAAQWDSVDVVGDGTNFYK